jgi:hypothetical protein
MKITRHDQEGSTECSWGQLLGIQHENNYIEVSDSYPLVNKDSTVLIINHTPKNNLFTTQRKFI